MPAPFAGNVYDRGSVFCLPRVQGVMEGAVRNLSDKKFCAACAEHFPINGWMYQALWKRADPLSVEWGSHIDPSLIDEKLSTGEYG